MITKYDSAIKENQKQPTSRDTRLLAEYRLAAGVAPHAAVLSRLPSAGSSLCRSLPHCGFIMSGANPIINGGLMQSYVGQEAALMGKFESVSETCSCSNKCPFLKHAFVCLLLQQLEANGKLMKVKLTDGNVIVAVMKTPLSGPVAPGSCVLLEGKVENRNKFDPSAVRILPPEMCQNFDESLWNEMIAVLVENPDLAYEFGDVMEHFGVDEVAADGSNADLLSFPDNDNAEVPDGKAAGEDQFDRSLDDAFNLDM